MGLCLAMAYLIAYISLMLCACLSCVKQQQSVSVSAVMLLRGSSAVTLAASAVALCIAQVAWPWCAHLMAVVCTSYGRDVHILWPWCAHLMAAGHACT
jgi:hypothetical protein